MDLDQSFNESYPSSNIEASVYITYFNMIFIAVMATTVVTPSVMVINVIWWTKELHTRYYFFVANLLATDIVSITVRSISQYLIMILYLLGLDSDSAQMVLQLSIFPLFTLIHLMTIILPVTVAIERMIVIGLPYRHRSIMTTKTVIGILATMLGVSLTFTVMITIVVSVYVVWPLALVYYDATVTPFFVILRLTSTVFIIVANSFLYYKVYESNKVYESTTKSSLLVGGIDVIGNVLISFVYTLIKVSTEPNTIKFLPRAILDVSSKCLPFNMSPTGLWIVHEEDTP